MMFAEVGVPELRGCSVEIEIRVSARPSTKMDDGGLAEIVHSPKVLSHLRAQIDILVIHEERLCQEANVIECAPPSQHESSGDTRHVSTFSVIPVSQQMTPK